jgi:hypothetical protein
MVARRFRAVSAKDGQGAIRGRVRSREASGLWRMCDAYRNWRFPQHEIRPGRPGTPAPNRNPVKNHAGKGARSTAFLVGLPRRLGRAPLILNTLKSLAAVRTIMQSLLSSRKLSLHIADAFFQAYSIRPISCFGCPALNALRLNPVNGQRLGSPVMASNASRRAQTRIVFTN